MKRIFEVKVVRAAGHRGTDNYEFNVVADSPVKAMTLALNKAIKMSGYKTPWRVTKLVESETRVIS